MSSTRTVHDVRIYFSKDINLLWENVEDFEWEDDHCLSFTDRSGQKISIAVPSHLVVVTKKEIPNL